MMVWNSLANVSEPLYVNLFKSTVPSYYFCALETSHDPENPGTFKTICTKCNTARTLVQPACQLLLLIYIYIIYYLHNITCLILRMN